MEEKKPLYNVKKVIKETGLNPATLRAWERRYGILNPTRSPGGQRLYSEDEILLLKWLVARKNEGMTISRAIDLWRSQSTQSSNLPQISPGASLALVEGGDTLDQLCKDWYQACLAFNEGEAEQAVAKAMAISSPEVACTRVMQKGLACLGEGWYAGKVSVQQEHFASALAARRLNALLAFAPEPIRPGRMLAVCPPGESHDLALLMLSFILRWRGWEVIYLGADSALERLDTTLRTTSPHLVLSAAQTLPAAASLVELTKVVNSQSIPLAFGGGIFNQIDGLSERIPGYFLGRAVSTAPEMIEFLLTHQPPIRDIRPLPPTYSAALVGFKEKEALIVSRVKQLLHSSSITPRHLEVANANFTQAVAAALALGEIHFLDYSANWLNRLLANYGVSPAFAVQYYQAFHQAVQEQLGDQAEPILDWLDGVKSFPEGQ